MSAKPRANSKTKPKRRSGKPGLKNFKGKIYQRPLGWSPKFFGLNPGGRPRAYKSAAELSARCFDYFAKCTKYNSPFGIFGLALHLEIIYTTFMEYESGKYDTEGEKFSAVLKAARLAVATSSEKIMMSGANATGPMFHLQQISRHIGDQWKSVGSNEVTGKDGKDLPTGPTIVLPDNARGDLYSAPSPATGSPT